MRGAGSPGGQRTRGGYGSFPQLFGWRGGGKGGDPAPRVIVREGGDGEGPDGQQGTRSRYSDNVVSTARYSWLTFVPRCLFEQFRRVANLYFLLISVLMLLGKYTKLFDSPLTPWSTLDVLVLVLLVSIGKEGVEDNKRHRADWETNRRIAQRLSSDSAVLFEDVQWQKVAVGDILRVENGGEMPADIVLLTTSEASGTAYIETSNIDGETNLKVKNSIRTGEAGLPLWTRPEQLVNVGMRLECEPPNSMIHHFGGTLYLQGGNQTPVDASSLLLRGSSVKNTRWVLGIVVYTGPETKIVMNSRKTPSKLSSIERTMNNLIYLIFAAQVLISAVSLVSFILWKSLYYKELDYLCYSSETSTNNLYRVGCKEGSDYSDSGYFFTFFILYNNFLPISLYVTVEICNYFQAYFIEKDLGLYDEASDMAALARTSNMNSDLGMVEYIFSDKTGTLTDNVMKFRRCSIAGVVYGDPPHVPSDALAVGALNKRKFVIGRPLREIASRVGALGNEASGTASPLCDFVSIMAVCHTVEVEAESGDLQSESPDEEALVKAAAELGWSFVGRRPGHVLLEHNGALSATAVVSASATTAAVAVTPSHSSSSSRQAPVSPLTPSTPVQPKRSTLVSPFSPHSPPSTPSNTASAAAAAAAAAVPLDELRRTRKALGFDVLAIVPFTSTRKRMSAVVRRPNGTYCVFSKGADNVIFDRCVRGAGSADQKRDLVRHLEVFASDGLRTLVLAKKELTIEQYEVFAARWKIAQSAVMNREDLIRDAAELIESDLTIVGATAIEDKLQDGVPQTILDLGNAGVKLWVLTGDKMETAINIGYSARLLGPEMVLIRLQDHGEDHALLKRKLRALVSQFVRLTQNHGAMQRAWRSMRDSLRWVLRRGASVGGKSEKVKVGSTASAGAGGGAPKAKSNWFWFSSLRGSHDNSDGEDARLLGDGQSDLLEKPLLAPSLDQLTSDHLALIVDGETLLKVFGDAETEKLFLSVATICKSVIACRVSPEQKRLMVRLVKRGVYPRPVTLSIGDGANDVAMIQEAQIGVGISGKEGRQAVNSSDFAIAQFRFLKRLMLVHGRTDYRRTCKVVLYSFYKNIVLTLVLFAFTFYSGYSGQSLFDDYIYSSYNLVLAAPVVAFGVFDIDISTATLEKYNFLYVSGREGLDMNVFVLFKEMLQAIVDAALVFFIPYACYFDPLDLWAGGSSLGQGLTGTGGVSNTDAGKTAGIWVFGTTVFTAMVLSMLLRAAMLTYTWTYITHICFWGSAALYVAFVYVYQYMPLLSYNFYGTADAMWTQPSFYWVCVLVPCASLVVELAYRLFKREFRPSIVDVAIEFDAGQSGAGRAQGLLFEEVGGIDAIRKTPPELYGDPLLSSRDLFSEDDDDDDDDVDSDDTERAHPHGHGLHQSQSHQGGLDDSGYMSDGSIGSVASETLETSLRYSSILHSRGGRSKVPLDWQSVRLFKAALTSHEQEALGLHDGSTPDSFYNYDMVDGSGYGPGAGTERRLARAASRPRLDQAQP